MAMKRKAATKRKNRHGKTESLRAEIWRLRREHDEVVGELRAELIKTAELQSRLKQAEFWWTTREGERVKPKDMTESHLRNTICWLQRRLAYGFGTLRWLSSIAPSAHAFHEMLSEAERRGLEV